MSGKDRIRIGLVIRDLNDRSGGAERIYCELANMLAEDGYAVTCLTFDHRAGAPFYALHPSVELINLHPAKTPRLRKLAKSVVKRAPIPRRWREFWQWRLRNALFVEQLRDFIRGYQPQLMISLLPPANTPTLLAARDMAVKVVACNHNVPEEDYRNPERWDPNPYDQRLRLAALDRADRIHVLSEEFADWFPRHLNARIRIIPNYVSGEFLDLPPSPQEREATVLAVGRLAQTKNYEALVHAWARLARHHGSWQVKLFGDGPQAGRLARLIRELEVDDSFRLCGRTDRIAEQYRRASIFCHPAHYEGFGLSAAEALACGLPVVAYRDTPGLQSFLADGENALLAHRTGDGVAGLADALDRMIRDRNVRQACARRAPGSVHGFSFEAYRARWNSLIDELVEADR